MTEKARPSWLQTVRTVAWSLIGIRNSSKHGQDQRALRPLPLIFTALGATLLFVLALLGLVHWIA
ncbi:DUF2970 domain-containing protein [Comamonas badia]|jgi:hypothetical protein|uniref:DUF2970 domain-containing protein n=1 Tax=Comamonas badia TaxID=265291 RepID=UPI0004112CDE|nr:DUF2970 domain-containing protein [Comamonas badia]